MSDEKIYQAWKEARATSPAPEGFAGRVLDTTAGDPPMPGWAGRLLALLERSGPARAAALLLAVAALAFRALSAMAVLIFTG